MPNWSNCHNEMYGEKEVIEKIYKGIIEKGFSFDDEFKIPCELEDVSKSSSDNRSAEERAELVSKYGFDNSYDWAVANWGTKWDTLSDTCEDNISIEYLKISSNKNTALEFSYQGAWCGGSEWFKKVCKKYLLDGTYFDSEQGCDFAHLIEIKNGEVIQEAEDEYFSDLTVEMLGEDFLYSEAEYIFTTKEDFEDESKAPLLKFMSKYIDMEKIREEVA